MRVLLIKMSSLGDVIHTLPALTDARRTFPNIQFDWIVEKGFAEIPAWHPAVGNVFPIRLRQWRRQLWSPKVWRQMRRFFDEVAAAGPYDLILDAQGLLKSAFVARKAQKALEKGRFSGGEKSNPKNFRGTPIWGMDRHTVREALAAGFFDQTVNVPKERHAIERLRQLFAAVLDYDRPDGMPDYAVSLPQAALSLALHAPWWVFLHGTTWDTKLWPEDHWRALIGKAVADGRRVLLPWGDDMERERALRLASGFEQAIVPDVRLSLGQMAHVLKGAERVVAVDTGLAHLAAALDVPTVVLYRVTDPARVGVVGHRVRHLISPVAHQHIKKFESDVQASWSLTGLETEAVWRSIQSIQ